MQNFLPGSQLPRFTANLPQPNPGIFGACIRYSFWHQYGMQNRASCAVFIALLKPAMLIG